MSVSGSSLDRSRNEPTALCHNKTYRRGVGAPEKSSLPFFVLIGLAVGLFAFGMMTFCLPDPLEKLAAREAAAAQTFPPPVFKPIEAAPPVAEVVVAPEPAAATVTTITPATKQARVIRRHPPKKAATGKTAQLPSNPYAN